MGLICACAKTRSDTLERDGYGFHGRNWLSEGDAVCGGGFAYDGDLVGPVTFFLFAPAFPFIFFGAGEHLAKEGLFVRGFIFDVFANGDKLIVWQFSELEHGAVFIAHGSQFFILLGASLFFLTRVVRAALSGRIDGEPSVSGVGLGA